MMIQSPIIKVLLFLFAAIGLMTIVAVVGMALMHSNMMTVRGDLAPIPRTAESLITFCMYGGTNGREICAETALHGRVQD